MHLACGLVSDCGVEIVRSLIDAGADRNARADENGSTYVSQFLENDWQLDVINDQEAVRLGGRTALHIVCARDDNFKVNSTSLLSILFTSLCSRLINSFPGNFRQ